MPDNRIDLTIIPATPGFFVLYLHSDMDAEPVEPYQLHPVIAWRIDTTEGKGRSFNGELFSDAEPVTPAGEIANDYLIIRPDGCVEHPHNATYESLQAAIEDFRKDRSERPHHRAPTANGTS